MYSSTYFRHSVIWTFATKLRYIHQPAKQFDFSIAISIFKYFATFGWVRFIFGGNQMVSYDLFRNLIRRGEEMFY